jgi:hypothetical protein
MDGKIDEEIKRINDYLVDKCRENLAAVESIYNYSQKEVNCTLAEKDISKFRDHKILEERYTSFNDIYVTENKIGNVPVECTLKCEVHLKPKGGHWSHFTYWPIDVEFEDLHKYPKNEYDHYINKVYKTSDGKTLSQIIGDNNPKNLTFQTNTIFQKFKNYIFDY